MKLHCEKGDYGKVFDANGVELLFVIGCDTETGEAEHLVSDGKGSFVLTDDGEAAKRVTFTHPAPLRFEREQCNISSNPT
jgi:hypothetical protein